MHAVLDYILVKALLVHFGFVAWYRMQLPHICDIVVDARESFQVATPRFHLLVSLTFFVALAQHSRPFEALIPLKLSHTTVKLE